MRKTILAVLGLAAVLTLSLSTSATAAPGGSGGTGSPSAAYACPVGDGPVTWGKAKICQESSATIRFHIQDSLTDGYPVRVQWWNGSPTSGAPARWEYIGPTAGVTGQWRTFVTDVNPCYHGRPARLVRVGAGGANTFEIPNTAANCPDSGKP